MAEVTRDTRDVEGLAHGQKWHKKDGDFGGVLRDAVRAEGSAVRATCLAAAQVSNKGF